MYAVLLLALCTLTSVYPFQSSDEYDLYDWTTYKETYGKEYKPYEEEMRKTTYMNNLKFIRNHNERYALGLETFQAGINQFSDMTSEEFTTRAHGVRMPHNSDKGTEDFPEEEVDMDNVPDEWDWRWEGAVTPVKDQGPCDSSWAFGSIGAVEGAHFLKTKTIVSLSEQNLVDCDKKSKGCNGGFHTNAFTYIKNNGGIDTESSYPYNATQGECRFNNKTIGAKITGYVVLPKGNEEKLKWAVYTKGPVAVIIDAQELQHYGRGGVFSTPNCRTQECRACHLVLVVGYGTTFYGEDYWIIKNSWGVGWGMGGYVYMKRNKNMCGLSNFASYPTI